MTARIEARPFRIGCRRSGTTLLQSMLFAHSEIFSFPETHFFKFSLAIDEQLTQRRQREGLRRKLVALVHHPMLMLGMVNAWTTAKAWEHMRFLPDFDPAGRHRSFQIVALSRLGLRHAIFIHITQSGPDTVASLVDAGKSPRVGKEPRCSLSLRFVDGTLLWKAFNIAETRVFPAYANLLATSSTNR
jgi:hypothetical protein